MDRKRIDINGHQHVEYIADTYEPSEMIEICNKYYDLLNNRRSVRSYSTKSVPKEVIETIIKTASTAPSGAHKQPWTFCAISNPQLKTQIRIAAEKEEVQSYNSRMSDRWKKDLEPIGTDSNKPFIENAPWIIVVFKKAYDLKDGEKYNNYYVNESVGIASGMLISAIHNAGLVTLTHTPSPMNFLSKLLDRPKNERAYLLLPVGYPQQPVYVPDLKRKSLSQISQFYE